MTNSMFENTMVNMSWTDIQGHVERNAIVLLPLGVIEEHGPHLCLGTDIYTAHIHSLRVQQRLEEQGLDTIIAPPFYWGICQSTGGFIGSFRIRKDTAIALLADMLTSLAEFGFKNVYGINGHGDIEHQVAILEAFKEAAATLGINICYPFAQNVMHHYGLDGSESHICPVKPSTIHASTSAYADVHGGDIETATIYHRYPHLVNARQAGALPPTALGDDKIMTWLLGGATKKLSPAGYLGDPASFAEVDVERHLDDMANRLSEAILAHLQQHLRRH